MLRPKHRLPPSSPSPHLPLVAPLPASPRHRGESVVRVDAAAVTNILTVPDPARALHEWLAAHQAQVLLPPQP
jgi:hypothetical protein